VSGGETVGACTRCDHLLEDGTLVFTLAAQSYREREVAYLCQQCTEELQRWIDDGGK